MQNTLGLYNDLFIAEDLFNKAIEHDPHFWFALGWIKAKQPYLQNQSAEALQKFKQAKTFGKHLKVATHMSRLFIGIYQILSIPHYLLTDRYNYHYAVFLAYRGHRQV